MVNERSPAIVAAARLLVDGVADEIGSAWGSPP